MIVDRKFRTPKTLKPAPSTTNRTEIFQPDEPRYQQSYLERLNVDAPEAEPTGDAFHAAGLGLKSDEVAEDLGLTEPEKCETKETQ